MNAAVVKRLIYKDMYFNRGLMTLFALGGLIALAVFAGATGRVRIVGAVMFMAAVSTIIFMPIWAVLGERREQNLAFIMSLPVTIMGYTTAKVVGTLVSGLGLWLVLMAAYVTVAITVGAIAPGSIPSMLATFGMILVIFCLNMSVSLVAESEQASILVTIFFNIVFWFFWSFFQGSSSVAPDLTSPTIVWRPEILWFLGVEAVAAPLILGIAFYLQSRKTDFI